MIYATYIVVGTRVSERVSPWATASIVCSAAGAVFVVIVASRGAHWPQTTAGWLAIGAIALVSTVAAITLFFAGLARIGATRASTLSTVEPLFTVLLVAILVIYMVLGILYESFIHPLTILSGLPAAGFGALLTLLLFRTELSIYAFVGIIMLVGIVKKNAIMMIDFALDAERNEGKPPMEAIYSGALVRFRPIMMTTFAALMGISARTPCAPVRVLSRYRCPHGSSGIGPAEWTRQPGLPLARLPQVDDPVLKVG